MGQYRTPDGWRDADWLSPDGTAPVAAAETFDPVALPSELHHTVTIALTVEQVKDGAAGQQTLVEVTLTPALGEGRAISLTHMPMDWPADGPPTGRTTSRCACAAPLPARTNGGRS